MLVNMGSSRKYSHCPWCDFAGHTTFGQRCEHMREHHYSNIVKILGTMADNRKEALLSRGTDPFCWASGVAFKSGFGFFDVD